jgi:hypothetical protein
MAQEPITLTEQEKDALSMVPHLLDVIQNIIQKINNG